MRLSEVTISTSDDSEEIQFSLRNPKPGFRYLIRAMVGLDAEEIIPKFYGFGLYSGKKLYEYTMKPRELVMRIALNPRFSTNEDVSEVRDRIYRIISANRSGDLTIRFNDGGSTVSKIVGSVIKMEVAYFTQTPELQVTFKCQDPIFRGEAPVNIKQADIPNSNPLRVMDPRSTAPHGFEINIHFSAASPDFTIQDDPTNPDWKFEVTPDAGFAIDDILVISSEYGNKRVLHDPFTGSDVSLLDKVSQGSVWPQIFPGMNAFYIPQIDDLEVVSVDYYPAYWGL